MDRDAGERARSSNAASDLSSRRSLDEPTGDKEEVDQDLKFIRRVRILELRPVPSNHEYHEQPVSEQLSVEISPVTNPDSLPNDEDGKTRVSTVLQLTSAV